MFTKRLKQCGAVCVVAAATTFGVSAPVSAASQDGWIGPTPVLNGKSYLHYSTISNTPLFANTRIYTTFGTAVPPMTMGVRSRLFKSGALCVINPVTFNSTSTGSFTGPTSGDCGPGSYNSHGFVLASDGTNYQEFPTFPTNPLDWGTGAAAAAANDPIRTNARGETYGSAADVKDDAKLPDLILSIGTGGQKGYIRSADVPSAPKSIDQVKVLPEVVGAGGQKVRTTPAKQISLYESDGVTVIGQFRVGR